MDKKDLEKFYKKMKNKDVVDYASDMFELFGQMSQEAIFVIAK